MESRHAGAGAGREEPGREEDSTRGDGPAPDRDPGREDPGRRTEPRGQEEERELARRFALRAEPFSHGAFAVEMIVPRAADELIDEAEFDADERLPYWADLWPSARALARHLLDSLDAPGEDRRLPVSAADGSAGTTLPPGRALELGAGVALPSLALHSRGVEVIATDYYDEALRFARANAVRNRLPPLPTAPLDWRAPSPGLGRFELVIAADVLYERRNAEALAELLPRLLAPGGEVRLADPGRVYLGVFLERMGAAGWSIREAGEWREATGGGEGAISTVRVLALSPPG